MRIRVLGAAAGGAFPQWNCSCSNCSRLRQGRFAGSARSQAQLAVSTNNRDWFLINASPDLRYQIEDFPPLHPSASHHRHSPIRGVVLLSAEVDAALGLLLLRESQPFTVYATSAVRRILTEDNSLFGVLRRQPDQVRWIDISPNRPFSLAESNISCEPIAAGGGYPGFVSRTDLPEDEAVLGIVLEHAGKRVAVIPGLARIEPALLDVAKTCDVVFIDGTFWSENELIQLQGRGKLAREMGHVPVQETLNAFRDIAARKIFLHINNTNPVLDESSAEHAMAKNVGWEVAFDGLDLVV